MKNTPLYIWSILVIGFLALSILMPARHILSIITDERETIESNEVDINKGQFNVGKGSETDIKCDKQNCHTDDRMSRQNPITVHFRPYRETMMNLPDSMSFSSGARLPFLYGSGIVMVDTSKNQEFDWIKWLNLIFTVLQIGLLFIILWKLIRFIINVSREKIFVIQNVKYLRQTSLMLYLIAICEIIDGLCMSHVVSLYDLKIPGYQISVFWDFPWITIIIGTLGFLFARIWKNGIAIKQDQELTI